MLNILVETKNDYTTHLSNILSPLVLEGLQSVYKQSLEIAKNNDVLKIFQSFLKAIPKWNQFMIEKETTRIINSSHSYSWLNDLIKATLKANLIVLMYNPSYKTQAKIDPVLYQNIKTVDFIHRVYIECARELWNNPYLLYHNYPPIEIKRNQRDCINIIKDCIKEALRKLLPVKHILEIYLGEDMEVDKNEEQFEKPLTDVEERNLTKIIQRDLSDDKFRLNDQQKLLTDVEERNLTKIIQRELSNDKLRLNENEDISQPYVENLITVNPDKLVKSNSEEKTIGSRILNIINNNSRTSSDIEPILYSDKKKESVLKKSRSETSNDKIYSDSDSDSDSDLESDLGLSVSDLKESIKKFEATLNANINNVKPEYSSKVEIIDDKIKEILQKDLATDSELETSLNYSQEDNDNKYQEIFSNSIVSPKKITNAKNLKDKNKFFNNYLHF